MLITRFVYSKYKFSKEIRFFFKSEVSSSTSFDFSTDIVAVETIIYIFRIQPCIQHFLTSRRCNDINPKKITSNGLKVNLPILLKCISYLYIKHHD